MTLRQYFPISVAVLAVVVAVTIYFKIPLLPFAVILLTAETLIGFTLEDHKVPRYFASIFKAPSPHVHRH
jgi:hypothetical protein